ncbi:ERMES complex Ca(2+)-binding regulatory GTPase gem1 [Ascosphaera acerosa]|nr:ERMES complex Ca(2+)-binding regulatory GTPase gem1 [Ascosphaera acerosa]
MPALLSRPRLSSSSNSSPSHSYGHGHAVRICVCGDESTGKSSLITSLVKGVFVRNRIQHVLPQVTIPPTVGTPDHVATTTVVDTSALPHERAALAKELRKCNVILLVYSDHYSYERVALFWLPYFRSLGVNVPVVLCANKSDLVGPGSGGDACGGSAATATTAGRDVDTHGGAPDDDEWKGPPGDGPGHDSEVAAAVIEEEMIPIMAEYKEIDSCIRTSARLHRNVNEAFFLCQKAVTHPIAPLFDSKEGTLKPAAVSALQRIFYLCDKDRDGWLNDAELRDFQLKCFGKPLSDQDLEHIKATIARSCPVANVVTAAGISAAGFLHLNRTYVEKGRHETVWIILRTFRYTDNLSLQESFLHPKFDVPPYASAELSPLGYRFFVDLFLLSDKDNDGGLNEAELAALFAPTPGIPSEWEEEDNFPACTVRNEAGHVTLQGWLAQWSMTTFKNPHTTLEYLAYLGFEGAASGAGRHGNSSAGGSGVSPATAPSNSNTTAALKITKARKNRRRPGRVGRNVVMCHLLGPANSGKSTLLDALLSRGFTPMYHPTLAPRTAVNTVELPGGKQCYLILNELGPLTHAVLDNAPKVQQTVDVIAYTYDSSDPDSFSYIPELRARHPYLTSLPSLFVAMKADLDRTTQRHETQPDDYAREQRLATAPLHVSATWSSVSELFVTIAETAMEPASAWARAEGEDDKSWISWAMGFGAVIVVGVAAGGIWRRLGAM